MLGFIKRSVIKIIPRKLLYVYSLKPLALLADLTNKRVKISYSQQGEDLILQDLFGDKRDGIYVDVGAFDPKKYSNTKLLYSMGWRGINIDANPESIEQFSRFRKKDINVNAGIGMSGKKLAYYMFNHPAVNSFDETHALEWASKKNFNIIQKIQIDTVSIEALLDEHLQKISSSKKIDFLNVDVEGMDLEVLNSNNWEKYRPNVVIVEDNNIYNRLNFADSSVIKFLTSKNYSLFKISGTSLTFRENIS